MDVYEALAFRLLEVLVVEAPAAIGIEHPELLDERRRVLEFDDVHLNHHRESELGLVQAVRLVRVDLLLSVHIFVDVSESDPILEELLEHRAGQNRREHVIAFDYLLALSPQRIDRGNEFTDHRHTQDDVEAGPHPTRVGSNWGVAVSDGRCSDEAVVQPPRPRKCWVNRMKDGGAAALDDKVQREGR